MEQKEMTVTHCVIQGTPYEAGYSLGKRFLTDSEQIRFMTSPFMGGSRLTQQQVLRVRELFDQFSPGLNEEMKGFAEAVGVSVKDVVYYYVFLQKPSCTCSQIALTPELTGDGHSYLGRNYDYGWNEKPVLMETRIAGQYQQIGFGCQLFGRFDGMNEHGLCMTTSAGVIKPRYEEEGFVFPFIVRTILGRCQTVGEAVKLMDEIPMADYRNYIIMDQEGDAVLIENAASKKVVQYAGIRRQEKKLFVTNHYNLSPLKEQGYPVVRHSLERYQCIEEHLNVSSKTIGKENLRKLLSSPMPEGVCCHHYADGMGTLWSIIFDSMEKTAEICFGSPSANEWRTFHFNHTAGMESYVAILPNESAENGFWDVVS